MTSVSFKHEWGIEAGGTREERMPIASAGDAGRLAGGVPEGWERERKGEQLHRSERLRDGVGRTGS